MGLYDTNMRLFKDVKIRSRNVNSDKFFPPLREGFRPIQLVQDFQINLLILVTELGRFCGHSTPPSISLNTFSNLLQMYVDIHIALLKAFEID